VQQKASAVRVLPVAGNDGTSGITEAEKIRQRILQRNAAAATEAAPVAQEDYEAVMERRRLEAVQKKRDDEMQERHTIIKNFHEKAQAKGAKRFKSDHFAHICYGVVVADENFVEKLVQLKGRRRVQSTLIEKSAKAMNEGDAFLLYTSGTLYIFYGKDANRMVRLPSPPRCVSRTNYNDIAVR